MGLHPLAVIGHVGPDFSGETMEEARALAALAALGQATRLSIFRLLVRKEPAGITAGALAEAVGCPHNTLSTHVAILARAGLVTGRREGRTINYRAEFRRNAGAHCLPRYGLLRRSARTMRSFQRTGTSCVRLSANHTITEESEQKRTAMTWTPTRAAFWPPWTPIGSEINHLHCRLCVT